MLQGDLISRSAVLEKIGKLPLDWEYGLAVNDCYKIVESEPALDVAPVVHEQWIDACRGKVCICSRCGQDFDHTCNAIKDEWLFCPKCGAKMDAEEGSNAG